VSLQTYAA
jgi:hypothetical protein